MQVPYDLKLKINNRMKIIKEQLHEVIDKTVNDLKITMVTS
jgi:hypothetical protein